MPPPDSLVTFAVAAIVLIVIPGPSVLFVVGRSLSYGRRAGVLTALGNELGGLPLVVAVALGVGAVVAGSIAVFTVVKLVGAAYLLYLGVQAIRHRRAGDAAEVGPDRPEVPPWRAVGDGFVVGVTNPKTIVFFVAVLPQFVDFHAGAVTAQMIVLGLLFITIAFVLDSGWALAAGSARAWFRGSPRGLAALRATGGTLMIGLAGALALTGAKA